MKYLDICVKRVLNMIFNTPSFKGYKKSDNPDLKSHAQIALQAASEGIVLLKNEKEALPLNTSIGKVALLGYTSYNYTLVVQEVVR